MTLLILLVLVGLVAFGTFGWAIHLRAQLQGVLAHSEIGNDLLTEFAKLQTRFNTLVALNKGVIDAANLSTAVAPDASTATPDAGPLPPADSGGPSENPTGPAPAPVTIADRLAQLDTDAQAIARKRTELVEVQARLDQLLR